MTAILPENTSTSSAGSNSSEHAGAIPATHKRSGTGTSAASPGKRHHPGGRPSQHQQHPFPSFPVPDPINSLVASQAPTGISYFGHQQSMLYSNVAYPYPIIPDVPPPSDTRIPPTRPPFDTNYAPFLADDPAMPDLSQPPPLSNTPPRTHNRSGSHFSGSYSLPTPSSQFVSKLARDEPDYGYMDSPSMLKTNGPVSMTGKYYPRPEGWRENYASRRYTTLARVKSLASPGTTCMSFLF